MSLITNLIVDHLLVAVEAGIVAAFAAAAAGWALVGTRWHRWHRRLRKAQAVIRRQRSENHDLRVAHRAVGLDRDRWMHECVDAWKRLDQYDQERRWGPGT